VTDRRDKLRAAVEAGEIEPWIAALARAWLDTRAGGRGEVPTAESIGAMLLDPKVITTLEREAPGGPWAILAAQARSVRAHGHLGDALRTLSDLL
jgi:hypothetical protein